MKAGKVAPAWRSVAGNESAPSLLRPRFLICCRSWGGWHGNIRQKRTWQNKASPVKEDQDSTHVWAPAASKRRLWCFYCGRPTFWIYFCHWKHSSALLLSEGILKFHVRLTCCCWMRGQTRDVSLRICFSGSFQQLQKSFVEPRILVVTFLIPAEDSKRLKWGVKAGKRVVNNLELKGFFFSLYISVSTLFIHYFLQSKPTRLFMCFEISFIHLLPLFFHC